MSTLQAIGFAIAIIGLGVSGISMILVIVNIERKINLIAKKLGVEEEE